MKLITVGKLKDKALTALVDEYVKRLKPYEKVEILEVADMMAPESNSDAQNEQVKKIEGERVLSKIKENEYVILLDLWGESITSEQLAAKIEKIYTYQSSNLTFVIGGSLGLSPELVKRADFRWKLSDCTFTHQMVRVLVLEQFYRATMINRHMPYHK
ncbi:23S rRNA (pseudouridine(1915)-N(3))-methyltransferase RlmH [Dielma fastidiosa]|uniref:Ribosomal RNA large subunit methyltransferase H n=1 Tax=Dielma fastidiosa TaxID=1034346 RepID=A0A318KHZ4_9FIRM|nr:23S rRNA (pseudouridine(1915)-N(3))-methyltransferase RlmH [Dielma fastidiosa]PXX77090.1 23S rRNA (pseudouridine1915-N3)-methyltransferase [Dielma fastidiosa]